MQWLMARQRFPNIHMHIQFFFWKFGTRTFFYHTSVYWGQGLFSLEQLPTKETAAERRLCWAEVSDIIKFETIYTGHAFSEIWVIWLFKHYYLVWVQSKIWIQELPGIIVRVSFIDLIGRVPNLNIHCTICHSVVLEALGTTDRWRKTNSTIF